MQEDLKEKVIKKALDAIKTGHKVYGISLLKFIARQEPHNITVKKLLYKHLQERFNISRANKIKSFFTKLRAEQLIKSGQIDNGLRLLEEAFELNPLNINILISITEILSHKNPEAINLLESVNIDHMQNVSALKKIAKIYLNAKNYPLAKKTLKRLLIINPNDLESQKMLKNLEALGVLEREFKSN